MNRVVTIELTGQARPIRLHEDAYDSLRAYLDQARVRLGRDPEDAEVVEDLERSIGERLAGVAGPSNRVIEATDVAAVLDEVGPVEVGSGLPPAIAPQSAGHRPARRRLYRIREGQDIAGVCTGLAAYTGLRVDWVRTIVLLLTVFTAGLFALVYLALMFALPVAATRAEWIAVMEDAGGAGAS